METVLQNGQKNNRFDVTAEDSLLDEGLQIHYTARKPGELVTMKLSCMDDENRRFESYGIFEANEDGIVDLSCKPMDW